MSSKTFIRRERKKGGRDRKSDKHCCTLSSRTHGCRHRMGCLRAFCPILQCLCMPHTFSVCTTYYLRIRSNMKPYSLPSPLLGQRENHPVQSPESLSLRLTMLHLFTSLFITGPSQHKCQLISYWKGLNSLLYSLVLYRLDWHLLGILQRRYMHHPFSHLLNIY